MKEFGFYPDPIEIDTKLIKIRPLPEHETIVRQVLACERVHDGWIYAPMQGAQTLGSDHIIERPYSARVFDLPKTHIVEHISDDNDEHLDFLLWVLSFFLGIRLTTKENAYLDATPVELGRLVDFQLVEDGRVQVVELAEAFWMASNGHSKAANQFIAAIHALFLGQNLRGLQFERFIYLYTAIDACYALAKSLKRRKKDYRHADRIAWMCCEFGLQLPDWANQAVGGGKKVSAIRNDALHEALFMDAPFGFALHGEGTHVNITHEMHALVCRLLVALIGGDAKYVGTPVNSMQRIRLKLR